MRLFIFMYFVVLIYFNSVSLNLYLFDTKRDDLDRRNTVAQRQRLVVDSFPTRGNFLCLK